MRNRIIEKLNGELPKELTSESQVVYILVEIRKMLNEHDKGKELKYPVLAFFCDWAVHTRMDRRSAISMLDAFQDFFRGLDAHLEIRKPTNFYPFVMFMVLRRQIKLFSKNNNLPDNLTDDPKKWKKFLTLLKSIVADCPILSDKGYVREFMLLESSENSVHCKLKYQDGSSPEFWTKSEHDFIEEEYSLWAKKVDSVKI